MTVFARDVIPDAETALDVEPPAEPQDNREFPLEAQEDRPIFPISEQYLQK